MCNNTLLHLTLTATTEMTIFSLSPLISFTWPKEYLFSYQMTLIYLATTAWNGKIHNTMWKNASLTAAIETSGFTSSITPTLLTSPPKLYSK